MRTTKVRLFDDAHRYGNFEKKIEVETWLQENLGPGGRAQPDRRWFFQYNRKRRLKDPTIFHFDVYFRNPADATFFRLKWP